MKILTIKGKNLASLEKEFFIDFTTEPLFSAGIFAITGSTGSGKTTILDALCLALFDKTPRNNQAVENMIAVKDVGDKTLNQNDCRNIMRRGSGECFSEVEFVALSGDKYRSHWSVRRAHGKTDGAMQSSEIRLWNLTSGLEEQGRKTELLLKITELIGLTFAQFTRSVLLAQGDFATFLKAKQSEKAELLEKLTGTEIYSKISIAIYEKTKQFETETNLISQQISEIQLLDNLKKEEYVNEKINVENFIKQLEQKNETLKQHLQWLETKQKLSEEKEKAFNAEKMIRKEIENAQPRFLYLEQLEQTQEVREPFFYLNEYKKQKNDKEKELTEKLKQQEEIDKHLEEINQCLIKIEKEIEQINEKEKEIRPQIIKAKELDVEIKNATQQLKEATEELLLITTQKNQTEKNIQETQSCEEKTKKQIKDLQVESEKLNNILPMEVLLLRSQISDGNPCPVCGSLQHPYLLHQNEQQDKNETISFSELRQKWQTNKTEMEKSNDKLIRLSATLEKEKEKLNLLCENLEQKKKKNNELEQNLSKLKLVRSNILHGKPTEGAENYFVEKKKQLDIKLKNSQADKDEQMAQQKNLEGETNQIQQNLLEYKKENQKYQDIVNNWLLNHQDFDNEKLTEMLSKTNDWLQKEKQELNNLRQNATSIQATLKERERKMEEHLSSMQKPNNEENIETIQQQIKILQEQHQQQKNRFSELSVILATDEKNVAQYEKMQKKLQEKEKITENWKKLNILLGSANGYKFKAIAQGYTLDALLLYANKHLQELSSRYKLERIPNTLALQVVDLDMLNEIRTVHSLSGGESFLISLALSLGLSSLSSNRMNVESLFIDEGFGSLDSETLRIAMDALEQLQMQGRKIGVISHVTEITERIPTQIRVLKLTNGKSEIKIV